MSAPWFLPQHDIRTIVGRPLPQRRRSIKRLVRNDHIRKARREHSIKRHAENTPLKGSQASATLKRTSLEREHPQASPEEETVLDTTLYAAEEEDIASELDWGNDTVLASAILGMGKLQGATASEELAPPPSANWNFNDPPPSRHAEGEGEMVLSSADSHRIYMGAKPRPRSEEPTRASRTCPFLRL